MNKTLVVILALLLSNLNLDVIAKDYKGAELRTKVAYTYGRFEVRYKAPQKDGVLASFFTYHEGTVSTWNELDIEIMGRYENDVQFNAITPGQTNHVRHQNVNFNPSVDFHDYAFEWTPDYVAWFVDGEMVLKQTEEHVATLTRAQKIMMNIWNPASANWAGVWNANVLPAFAYYDYVKYYAYTPGTGSAGTGNNFTQLWSDDFITYDANRWDKATHTFDGNNCDFIKENVVYKDGYMILCLTDAINIGYVDKLAPAPMWARYENNHVIVRFNEDLDQVSAETISNYLISGVTINSAQLLGDKKSVKLNVTGFSTALVNNLIMLNIKDIAQPANMLTAKAVTIANQTVLTFPIKINVGGNSTLGYLADKEFKYDSEYGYSEGTAATASTTTQISGTEEDEIYRSERYYITKYDVRVPNGTYNLKLMFAENYFTTVGSRVFDIYVQNTLVKDDLDIFQEVGKNSAYNLILNNVIVEDGIIKIHFSAEVNNTLINGIEINQISVGVNDNEPNLEYGFKLHQNYPNPFNGLTKIPVNIKSESDVQLRIFNVLGEMKYSKAYNLEKGIHELAWQGEDNNGASVSSGVYIYEVSDNRNTQSRKMLYLK